MNARRKLNQLHLTGDIVLAGIAGMIAQSWWIFFLALAVLVGLDLHAGQIRPQGRTRNGSVGGKPCPRHQRRGEANEKKE